MDYYALLFFRYLKSKGSKGLRMIYNVFKGGTEQLLPVNTDTPTTSPIIADIQYTDTLRENQEFTYRECPITVDGKAKLKSIKGNTIVWNQLVVDAYIPVAVGTYSWLQIGSYGKNKVLEANHVYLLTSDNSELSVRFRNESISLITQNGQNIIYKATTTDNHYYVQGNGTTTKESHINYYDLTAMFGSTKADEIYAMEQSVSGSGVAYFRSLFGLPYYAYDSGSLLSFNGTGIKTTGMNLCEPLNANTDVFTLTGDVYTQNNPTGAGWGSSYSTCTVRPIPLQAGTYTATCYYLEQTTSASATFQVFTSDNVNLGSINATNKDKVKLTFTLSEPTTIGLLFKIYRGKVTVQIEKGSTSSNYEPYVTSTATIPTSTYFPTGMKRAGSVYDELTNKKAITRIGSVDLGTLTWTYRSSSSMFSAPFTGYAKPSDSNVVVNGITVPYSASNLTTLVVDSTADKVFTFGRPNNWDNYMLIRDLAYTDADTFKASLDGVMLQYELAEESSVDVDPSDTNELLNNALSTIMGRNVSSNNPQQVLDVLTKGE